MKFPIQLSLIRKGLISGEITVDQLSTEKDKFVSIFTMIEKMSQSDFNTHLKDILDFIMICLDCYTYSETGETLISDHQYDIVMTRYKNTTSKSIIHADKFKLQSKWPFMKHEAPGVVGSVEKIYSEEELARFMDKNKVSGGEPREYIIAPKYDGISVGLKVNNGNIIYGLTRYDGFEGQDITQVVRNAHNSNIIRRMDLLSHNFNGYFKCELCVSKSDYSHLIEEKYYVNRRSATSGIVNSPKNLDLAKYVTIIPLAAYNGNGTVWYFPPDFKIIKTNKPHVMLEEIYKMLEIIRHADYEFRTDGVVIYPLGNDIVPNDSDIMDNAIAYKVNTEEAYTDIKYGYISIGRLGYAVPMLKVEPVEVNETIVEDVSLGSFDKYAGLDLHEGETVIVYSAGNVIPQIRVPERRHYRAGADYIKIKKRCPYCDEKLERIGNEYKCTNEDCPKVRAGRIVNFVTKLDAVNVSDATIQDLYDNKLIKDIPDLFSLQVDDIACLKGYAITSAEGIISEIEKIRDTEIPVSKFMGALGIQDISEKKCRNIFKCVTIDQVLDKSEEKLKYMLLAADKTADKTADTFVKFVSDNRKMIKKLLSIMNIVNDIQWKGNVVFTGFRNTNLAERFAKIGYEISDNVNSDTVAVIVASFDESSTKCKAARKKGISIVHVTDVEDVLKGLSKKY